MKTHVYAWILGTFIIVSGCNSAPSTQRSQDRGAQNRTQVTLDETKEKETPDSLDDFDDFNTDVDDPVRDIQRVTPQEPKTCYKGDEFLCEIEAAIVRQTNDLRAPAQPFEASAKIGYVARLWSESMSGTGFISHFGFPRGRVADYRDEFGTSASMQAENVAMNHSNSQDAEAIARTFTQMWWNSFGHRRNMLGNYAMLGVGVYRSGSRYYATQIFGRE